MNIATINFEARNNNAYSYTPKNTLVHAWSAVVHHADGMAEPIVARWYRAQSGDGYSPLRCSLWIKAPGVSISGRGKAGGGGYNKMSAAFDDACTSAGVLLRDNVHGAGESAVREAMQAICRALGYTSPALIVEHS